MSDYAGVQERAQLIVWENGDALVGSFDHATFQRVVEQRDEFAQAVLALIADVRRLTTERDKARAALARARGFDDYEDFKARYDAAMATEAQR